MDINFWKIISMLSLGFGSFLVAMIPGWFLLGARNFIFIKTIMLSFGGGVLISTAMLHILPEAREELPKAAELWFLGGFFVVYLVEELVHWYHERKKSERRQINCLANSANNVSSSNSIRRQNTYGAMGNTGMDFDATPNQENDVVNVVNSVDRKMSKYENITDITQSDECRNNLNVNIQTGRVACDVDNYHSGNDIIVESGPGTSGSHPYHRNQEVNNFQFENPNHVAAIRVPKKRVITQSLDIESTSEGQDVPQAEEQPLVSQHDSSVAGIIGMLVALLVHSCLEGFVIGVQSTKEMVIMLLIAVSSHKYVVGFCLGGELRGAPGGPGGKTHVVSALIFSLGSIFGVGFGAIFQDYGQAVQGLMPAIQAMAGGTLLYVALGEVIPRERSKRHSIQPSAGVCQCIAVAVGVILMAILNTYVHEPDDKSSTLSC